MQNKKTSEYREIFPYVVSPFHLLCSDPIFSQWPATNSLSLCCSSFSLGLPRSLYFSFWSFSLSPLWWSNSLEVLKLFLTERCWNLKEDKVKKCVEENRDKGEIKKTEGKEMWLRKKGKKRRRKGVVLVLVIRMVWLYVWCGARVWTIYFIFFKVSLWKKKLY